MRAPFGWPTLCRLRRNKQTNNYNSICDSWGCPGGPPGGRPGWAPRLFDMDETINLDFKDFQESHINNPDMSSIIRRFSHRCFPATVSQQGLTLSVQVNLKSMMQKAKFTSRNKSKLIWTLLSRHKEKRQLCNCTIPSEVSPARFQVDSKCNVDTKSLESLVIGW